MSTIAYIFLSNQYLININSNSDTTLDQLISFMEGYQYEKGRCNKVATRLHNIAEVNGIRAYVVSMELTNSLHDINAFDTNQGTFYADLTQNKNIFSWEVLQSRYSYIGKVHEYGR